jgi:prepilin-type processing-associated H-X9-DG protein/prepilin-type N-terminal cleavage/methylation domain-containing protein
MGRESGFTLVELLTVIVIVAVLAALLISATGYAYSEAQTAQCASNLRQWGAALHLYCADNDGYLPRRGQGVQPVTIINRPTDWFNALPPYLGMATFQTLVSGSNGVRPPQPGDKSVFVCPAATGTVPGQYFLCYGMNMNLSTWNQTNATKLSQVPDPEFLAFMADSPGGYASTVPSSAQYSVQPRHNGSANVVFLDGHVETLAGSYLGCGAGEIEQPDVRWQPDIPGITWNAP